MIQARYVLTSSPRAFTGDTATWQLDVTNAGLQTEAVTITFPTPFVPGLLAEDLTIGAASYTRGGSSAGGSVHTLPPQGRVTFSNSYVVPDVESAQITSVAKLTWPKTPATARVSGATITQSPNVLEAAADSVALNVIEPVESYRPSNPHGLADSWISSEFDTSSQAAVIDAIASGYSFKDFAESLSSTPSPGGGTASLVRTAVTGTSYTITATDANLLIPFTNAGAVTVTVPLDAAEDLADGFESTLLCLGAGGLSVSYAGTWSGSGTPNTVISQDQYVGLKKTTTADTWYPPIGATA